MSSDTVIRADKISKCYHIYDTPRNRLKQFVLPRIQRASRQPQRQYFHEFWALKDVSFKVKKGETVGIIGRNGSGKSTLLQLICGTLHPTSGTVETKGRVAALLELGSGFNPEFTGRENVYMNASILGLTTEEIDDRFDDITAFADIGEFIEQPVKMYSSGMVVRLAFAVAINVEPDILVVDEALAVGDELFQRKCFSRIEAIRDAGATILFVSHSGALIIELCDRAALLESGEKLAIGAPKQIVGYYQKLIYAPENKSASIKEQILRLDGGVKCTDADVDKAHIKDISNEVLEGYDPYLKSEDTVAYEPYGAYIENPSIYTLEGKKVNNLVGGRTYCYTYQVRFAEESYNVRFGCLIKTVSGVELGEAPLQRLPRALSKLWAPVRSMTLSFIFAVP